MSNHLNEHKIIMRINKTDSLLMNTLGIIARPNVGVLKTVAILISPNTFVFSFDYSLSRSRRISNDFVTLNFIYHVRYPACLLLLFVYMLMGQMAFCMNKVSYHQPYLGA